jgi:hypothetical protein
MVEILHRNSGFKVILIGLVDLEEARRLIFGLRDEIAGGEGAFVLELDVKSFRYFAIDAQAEFELFLEELLERGLSRISVVAYSTGFAGFFTEMMLRIDAMEMYQYIDVAYEEDWEEALELSFAFGD